LSEPSSELELDAAQDLVYYVNIASETKRGRMIRNYFWLFGEDQAQKRRVITQADRKENLVVRECYCPNGHSILTDLAVFGGHQA